MDPRAYSAPSERNWAALYVVIAIAGLYLARAVLVPFALAVLLTFVVTPLVLRIERRVRSRAVAVALVTIALVGLSTGGAITIVQSIVGFADDLPAYRETIARKVRTIQSGPGNLLSRTAETVRGIEAQIASHPAGPVHPGSAGGSPTSLNPPLPDPGPAGSAPSPPPHTVPPAAVPAATQLAWAALRPLAGPLSSGAIVVLLLVIMLMSRERIRDRLIRLAGLHQIGLTTQTLGEAGIRVGNYLRSQLLINSAYGACVGVALLAIGVPSALLCGLFAGITRFIPVVGPWLGAAVPAALALAVFDDWHHLLIVVSVFAILEILANLVFEPWLYGSSTGLSGFGVVIAIIFWTWVWGGVGLILAVPMTACLIVFARQVPQLGALAIILGDEPVLADAMRLYQRLLCKDDDEAAAILAAAPADKEPADTIDEVVISGLVVARSDRRRGLITASQGAAIAAAAAEIAGDWLAGLDTTSVPAGAQAPDRRVACIPLADEIDEGAATLLALLLRREGMETDVGPAALLLAERIDRAAAEGIAVVLVCSVGGAQATQMGRICKALNRRAPDRPVVLVVWDQEPGRPVQSASEAAGPYAVVNSAQAAIRTALALLGTQRSDRVPVALGPTTV